MGELDTIIALNGRELAAFFNVNSLSLYMPGVWTTRRCVWEPEHPKGEEATEEEQRIYGKRKRKITNVPYRHDFNIALFGEGDQIRAYDNSTSGSTLRDIVNSVEVPWPVPPAMRKTKRRAYMYQFTQRKSEMKNKWLLYEPQATLPRVIAPVYGGTIVGPDAISACMPDLLPYTTPLPEILFAQAEYRYDKPVMVAMSRLAA